jgi:hypothetical protein
MEEGSTVIERRIIVASAIYAGVAALYTFNTARSLGFVILVQSNYAVGRGPLRQLVP